MIVQEKAPHMKFYGEDPKYAKYLRTFGEIGVTAISSNKVGRTKLDPRGHISMFVGYSLDHPADTYCLSFKYQKNHSQQRCEMVR